MDFQPYILQTTQEYVSMFFDVDPDLAPPVFEKSFCNYHEMPVPVVQYRRGIDELIRQDTHLYKGHVVHLWPDGYKVRAMAQFKKIKAIGLKTELIGLVRHCPIRRMPV